MYVMISGMAGESNQSLFVCKFDQEEGQLEILHRLESIKKAAYIVTNESKNRLYIVGAGESNEGEALSYAFEPSDGSVTLINRRPTLGLNPNYASINKSGTILFAVNFTGGSICLLPIDQNGFVQDSSFRIQYEGSGPVPGNQASPHPHSIVPDPSGRFVLVSDLGTDKVHIYLLDEERQRLHEHSETPTSPGSGPRHVLFHPNLPYVYVIHELNAMISVYDWDPEQGTLHRKQEVKTLPESYGGANKCADIRISPCGTYLYGSNRGHDSIVAFAIQGDGLLAYVGHTATNGRNPRCIAISPNGRYMLVANEGAGHVALFFIRPDTGALEAAGKLMLEAKPICIKFIDAS